MTNSITKEINNIYKLKCLYCNCDDLDLMEVDNEDGSLEFTCRECNKSIKVTPIKYKVEMY